MKWTDFLKDEWLPLYAPNDGMDKSVPRSCKSVKTPFVVTGGKVYIPAMDSIDSLYTKRQIKPNAYATANGAETTPSGNAVTWTRCPSGYNNGGFVWASAGRMYSARSIKDKHVSMVMEAKLDIDKVLKAREVSNLFRVKTIKENDKELHAIEMGEYPNEFASKSLNKELENEYQKGKLVASGKKYVGSCKSAMTPKFSRNEEFVYNGEKYVRVSGDEPSYIKVTPLRWVVENWDEMPKDINPKGNGSAESMVVQTMQAVMSGVPYSSNFNNSKDGVDYSQSMLKVFADRFAKESLSSEISIKKTKGQATIDSIAKSSKLKGGHESM